MAEYIERKTAVCAIKDYVIENCPEYMRDWATRLKQAVSDDITDEIMKISSADVVPVVHGRWSKVETDYLTRDLLKRCSVCGYVGVKPHGNYCSLCGAKMDGGEKDAAN